MARAFSRRRLNASMVAKSGRGAPSRMQSAMKVLATFFREPATSAPACSSLSMPGTDRITTSAVSPPSSLPCRAPTVPKSNATSWPAPCANALPSAPTATCIERAHITLSLATAALRRRHTVPRARRPSPSLEGQGEESVPRRSRQWQRSTPWKSSASSSRAPTSSSRRSRSIRSWRRWRRWPASRRRISSGGSLGWYKGVTEAGLSLDGDDPGRGRHPHRLENPGGAGRRRRLGRSGPHPPHHRHVRGRGRRVHRDRGPASAAPGRASHRHRQSGADRRSPPTASGRRSRPAPIRTF